MAGIIRLVPSYILIKRLSNDLSHNQLDFEMEKQESRMYNNDNRQVQCWTEEIDNVFQDSEYETHLKVR